MSSVEENVEQYYKNKLDNLGIRHYSKTEKINKSIDDALKNADSKSGNKGNNYPDIKLLLEDKHRRNIPVMIEAKGSKGKLEKLTKDGHIELISNGKNPYSAVMNYAVNGALHYGLAILDEGTYKEVIIIGINGSDLIDDKVSGIEIKAYYVSEKNNRIPKEIKRFDLVQITDTNIDGFYALLDSLNLTGEEVEKLKRNKEELLEKNIKNIHQRIYDDADMKNLLSTNDKLYFFCGLIMAGLTTEGVRPLDIDDLPSNNDEEDNDGKTILTRTKSFLKKKNCSKEKIDMIIGYLKPVFEKPNLWKPKKGESIIKSVYKQIKNEILPLLESNIHLDFTGRILNSLNDWVAIENDKKNDVVLTPRFVTNMMARICKTDMDSFLWDTCMGSSGFLISGMDLMIADAKERIKDKNTLEQKISDIKSKQLLGIEILGNIYILAVLNMILMGDGSSQVICNDCRKEISNVNMKEFPANVFLLNPPYSAEGKGLIFVDEALSKMEKGYGAVLIQENAGSGQGDVYSKRILQKNTLIASVHMPVDIFNGKSSVQTAIYVFKVNRPHEEDDIVTFVDFSEDGYSRQNRKKSTQEVNLRNTDHALERYDEVVAICLGKKPKTDYYTESNGKVIKDTISLNGDDWTFNQHKKVDTIPTKEDFKKAVTDYLAWKVSSILKGQVSVDE